MDIVFVEDAENKIHGDQCRRNQDRLVGQRRLKGLGRALICSLYARRHAHLVVDLVHRFDGVSKGRAGSQIERKSNDGKLTLMVHGNRNGTCLYMRKRVQRDLATIRERDEIAA